MSVAAVAVSFGLDPVVFLSRAGVEWAVQREAVVKAANRRVEDDQHRAKALAIAIVNQLAKAIK